MDNPWVDLMLAEQSLLVCQTLLNRFVGRVEQGGRHNNRQTKGYTGRDSGLPG
jgi:hypothetical protein